MLLKVCKTQNLNFIKYNKKQQVYFGVLENMQMKDPDAGFQNNYLFPC